MLASLPLPPPPPAPSPTAGRVRPAVLFLLTAVLLVQWGGACTYLFSRVVQPPQQEQQLEVLTAATAQALSRWLTDPDDAAPSLVLAPDSDNKTLHATAQSGVNIPPPLWFKATQDQHGQPLLSPPVNLEGTKYIIVGRARPDGSTVLHARPLSTLRALLARAENPHTHGVVLLHTRTGEVSISNTPPVDALRQALAQPHAAAKGTSLPARAGHVVSAPIGKSPTAGDNPLGYVAFIQSAASLSLSSQLSALLRQSPLLWGWQCLCTMLLGWLLRRIWITWGPRDTPPSNMLACSLQAQLTATTAQLQAETAHRRHLSGQCIRLLENIRLDLGRELHDQTGQRLAALLLMLEARPPSKPPETVLQEAIPHLRHIQEDVRHLARGLRPPALSGTGLGGLGLALRSLCDEYAQAGMRVQYFDDHVPALDTERSLALYRICQEALTNAAKHAQARSVFVSLVGRGNTLTLTIEDDGQGFTSASSTAAQMPAQDALPAPTSPSTGMGLLLMRERMAQWGGQLTIDSAAGKGCTIMAELPL